jgi:hypothetical protein
MNSCRLPEGKSLRRLIGDQHHGYEIGREIVERSFVERLVDGVCPAAEHELVAVGRRLHYASRAHHSTGAADVLDDHLLAQDLGQAAADDASEHIGSAAGSERNHHGQRPVRPDLRGGRTNCVVAYEPADDHGQ